jgi:protein SCO1/2
MLRLPPARCAAWRIWAAPLLLSCGLSAEQDYEVTGVVESLDAAARQVTIAHDPIPGFMPAMTMNFDVASADLLAGVEPGSHVHFHLRRSATELEITRLSVTAPPAAGFASAELEPLPEIAPDFALTDHEGNPFQLSQLRGQAVLLSFIFTSCPGPCPMQTAAHVRLSKHLPEALRARTHFVEVSIDPANDTPARLREYGAKRGVDFAGWTFCTGTVEDVQAVLDAYHIGKTRAADGELIHTLVTYLIAPDGRLVKIFLGLSTPDAELIGELERVLR